MIRDDLPIWSTGCHSNTRGFSRILKHILYKNTVDKTKSDYSSNKECPICYTDYKIKSSVRLNCDHKVCRDWFFKILVVF